MTLLTTSEVEELIRLHLPEVDHRDEVVEEITAGYLRLRLPMRPQYISSDLPPGTGQSIVSGPVMMGLADTAMYAAIHAFYGKEAFGAIVTINTSFLRITPPEDLIAETRLLKRGKSLAFLQTHIRGVSGSEPCAQVSATYSIWRG